MNNQTVDKISDLISQAKYIAVVLSNNPSIDATAAGLALSLSLSKIGKKVDVICPTLPTVSLGNLIGVNKIKQGNSGGNGSGLVISLPYQQGAIEKISYDIVGERINLTVVPGPQGLNFTPDDISYQTPSQQADLLISIGVLSEEEVSSTANDTQSPLINIDYSTNNNAYGTIPLVDPSFSSQSELVTKLLSNLNAPIDTDTAQNLLSGIIDATGNFQRQDASVSAFEIAGMLMQKGARRVAGAPAPRDDFISAQEAKITSQMTAPNPVTWPQTRQQPQPAIHKPFQDSANAKEAKPQPFPQTKNRSDPSKTPKDWFEPKIYKGSRSTPIS